MTIERHRIVVSAQALRHNLRQIKRALRGRALIAVVKADAYGLGIERCVPVYRDEVDGFAVASLSEAIRVRRLAPQHRIIALSSPLAGELDGMLEVGCELSLSSIHEVDRLAIALEQRKISPGALTATATATAITIDAFADDAQVSQHRSGSAYPVHCFIDTGMGRTGCAPQQAAALCQAIADRPGLRLVGIGSHYASAHDVTVSADQEQLWQRYVAPLADLLPPDGWLHLANSDGLVDRPQLGNAARIGVLLTGACGSASISGLRQAITWQSELSLIKSLPAGHGMSYGGTHRLTRDSVIGLVPVGYADGYPLAASGRGWMRVRQQRVPILGRVTMDYCLVDLSDVPDVETGDQMILCEPDGMAPTVNQLAKVAGTIAYDILCGIRGRCAVTLALTETEQAGMTDELIE